MYSSDCWLVKKKRTGALSFRWRNKEEDLERGEQGHWPRSKLPAGRRSWRRTPPSERWRWSACSSSTPPSGNWSPGANRCVRRASECAIHRCADAAVISPCWCCCCPGLRPPRPGRRRGRGSNWDATQSLMRAVYEAQFRAPAVFTSRESQSESVWKEWEVSVCPAVRQLRGTISIWGQNTVATFIKEEQQNCQYIDWYFLYSWIYVNCWHSIYMDVYVGPNCINVVVIIAKREN